MQDNQTDHKRRVLAAVKDYTRETLKQYGWVFNAVEPCTRVHDLSFIHHRLVAKCKPPEQRKADAEIRMGALLAGIPKKGNLGSHGRTKTLPPGVTKKQSHEAQYAQAMDETRFAYQTVRDDSWVAGQFELSRRKDKLSFSHHKEVLGLDIEKQEKLAEGERRASELLAKMEKCPPGRPAKNGNTALPIPTLSDLGITKMQS